jgi:hypothetical protein
MLNWRREYKVDDIRNDIVYGGKNQPSKFPHADFLLKYAYQIGNQSYLSQLSHYLCQFNLLTIYLMNCLTITNLVCAFDALDKNGNCMSLETFDFSPKEVLKLITIDDYILFLTYSLGNVCTYFRF